MPLQHAIRCSPQVGLQQLQQEDQRPPHVQLQQIPLTAALLLLLLLMMMMMMMMMMPLPHWQGWCPRLLAMACPGNAAGGGMAAGFTEWPSLVLPGAE
jgi:hypothetical protein